MKRGSRGSALVEFVVGVPVLFLCLGGLVDLTRWFYEHMQVSRIVYEGARYGSSLHGLENGDGIVRYTNGTPVESAPLATVHGQLMTRINWILEKESIKPYEVIATKRPQADSTTESVVTVQMKAHFSSMLLKWLGMDNVTVKATAPYLYRNS